MKAMRFRLDGRLFAMIFGFCFTLSSFLAFGDQGDRVDVTGTVSSVSTDPRHPGVYACDRDNSTAWQLTAGSEEGRLELGLESPMLLSGVVASGSITAGTRLELQFIQGGRWVTFLSASLSDVLLSQEFIDLSYDRAVTDRIALLLRGPDASTSFLTEIEVVGVDPATVLRRIQPVELTGSENTSLFSSEENLIDGNTWTTWEIEAGTDLPNVGDVRRILEHLRHSRRRSHRDRGGASVDFSLGTVHALHSAHIYLPERLRGEVTLAIEENGKFREVAAILPRAAVGWHLLDLGGVEAEKVRLTMLGHSGRLDSIAEVELWGTGQYNGSIYEEVGYPSPLLRNAAVNYQFGDPPELGGTLEVALRGRVSSPLEVDLNGMSYAMSRSIEARGLTIHELPVGPNELWTGDNFLRIKPLSQDETVVAARIRRRPGGWENHLLPGRLADGFLYTPLPVDASTEYRFGLSPYVAAVEVYGSTRGTYTLEVRRGKGDWIALGPGDEAATHIDYAVGRQVDQLRIATTGTKIGEIRFLASPTTDQAPNLHFVWPEETTEDDSANGGDNRRRGKGPAGAIGPSRDVIVGFVDNPHAKVTVNGLPVHRHGQYFWLASRELASRGEILETITAVAVDKKGRTAEATMLYSSSGLALMSLDQPDELLYSDSESFTLSGTVRGSSAVVDINGVRVDVSHRRFTTQVHLVEGLNVLHVNLRQKRSGRLYASIIRRVIYYRGEIRLNVHDPPDGSYLSRTTVTVRGLVEAAGVAEVTVNGAAASVSGCRFVSQPLTLTEGTNRILVAAVDKLGHRATAESTLHVDTHGPILSVEHPGNGDIYDHSIVEISGACSDTSPVWVIADGKAAALDGSRFELSLGYNDAVHSIAIQAQDAAGNWSEPSTVQFVVDTTPPDELTVAAQPPGWTNNTRPVVTFSAHDATSGIDRFELSIDEGPPTTASSPFLLPSLADGVHTVHLRVYDRAGWQRDALVQLFIDTICPPPPPAFRPVPGNGLIELKWLKPSDDTRSYRISREPAWPQGAQSIEGEGLTDAGLVNGASYRYEIIAVDRAANESDPAEASARAGVETASCSATAGAVLEYQNLAVFVPSGAAPSEIQELNVTEVTSGDLADAASYPFVSPMYDFTAKVVRDGVTSYEENLAFDAPVRMVMSYDPSKIPGDFIEQNLGVYYFDPMWSRWFKVPDSTVDTVDHRILFSTTHFTTFSVQPTILEDLSPQQLKDVGSSPFATTVAGNGVTVSPQGGSAMSEVTEFTLPGRAGFDFTLKRTYDTATALGDAVGLAMNASIGSSVFSPMFNPASLLVTGAAQIDSQILDAIEKIYRNSGDYAYSMGIGWRLNLPYLRGNNGTILVRLPGGSFHSIYDMSIDWERSWTNGLQRSLVLVNHRTEDFTLSVHQTRNNVNVVGLVTLSEVIPAWSLDEATLTLKDGTVYHFDSKGRVTLMEDPAGLNTVQFNYDSSNPLSITLESIVDSMGHTLEFAYDHSFLVPRIKSITEADDGRTVSYRESSAISENTSLVLPLLSSATDVGGRTWSYHYDAQFLFGGSISFSVNCLTLFGDLVAAVFGVPFGTVSAILGKDSLSVSGAVQAQWIFPLERISGPGVGDIAISTSTLSLGYGESEATDYLWLPFVGQVPTGYEISENWIERPITSSVSISDSKGYSPPLTTHYVYDFRYHGYDQYYNASSTIDDGRQRIAISYSPDERTVSRYIDSSDELTDVVNTHFFTRDPFTHEVVPYETRLVLAKTAGGPTIEQRDSTWDLAHMRITNRTTRRSASTWQTQEYAYDGWGNVIYSRDLSTVGSWSEQVRTWSYFAATGSTPAAEAPWRPAPYSSPDLTRPIRDLPLGRATEISLPPQAGGESATYRHTYYRYDTLGEKTAESNWVGEGWAETTYGYDPVTGDLTMTRNPEGHVTTVSRDYTASGFYYITTTEEAVESADGARSDIARVDAFARATGFRVWARDANGYLTGYSYDALGRPTSITRADDSDIPFWDPRQEGGVIREDNPRSTLSYDDETLTTTAFGYRGQRSVYRYDSLGRLVGIEKESRPYDESGHLAGGPAEPIVTAISYGPWGEVTGITDPRGYTTNYRYDATGRTSAIVHPLEEGVRPEKSFAFDYETNTDTITDERENTTEETYDFAGRLLHRVRGEGIETSNWYDGLGEPVARSDAEGWRTTIAYNELGLPTVTTLPVEEYYEGGGQVSYAPQTVITYDRAGQAVSRTLRRSDGEALVEYRNDGLGRTIVTHTHYTDYREEPAVASVAVAHTFYDGAGNTVKSVDANNIVLPESERRVRRFVFSARGRLLSETDEAGNATSYTYDADDNLISTTDPNGFTATYAYDDLNRLIVATLPPVSGQTQTPIVHLFYDARGNRIRRVNADGGVLAYDYDSRNRVTTETREGTTPQGLVLSSALTRSYDAAGNEVSVTDALAATTVKYYDAVDRLTRIVYPEGNEARYGYDRVGNRTSTTDGNGNTTHRLYNSTQRCIRETDPTGGVTLIGYDGQGNRTYHRNPMGRVTTRRYDERGFVVEESSSLGEITSCAYDPAGNLVRSTDPAGTEKTITYTDNCLPQTITLTNASRSSVTTYCYDPAGQVASLSEDGVVMNYNTIDGIYTPDPYGLVHRLTRRIDGKSFTVSYAYDIMNRVIGIALPDETGFRSTYDTLGRLSTVPGYIDIPISWDPNHKLAGYRAANGVSFSTSHDVNQRLTELRYDGPGGPLVGYSLVYDGADNVLARNDSSYAYDALSRLVAATQFGRFAVDTTANPPVIASVHPDYAGQKPADFTTRITPLKVDYDATSLVADLACQYLVTRLALHPTAANHRLEENTVAVFTASDNSLGAFERQPDWRWKEEDDGTVKILFRNPVEARYLKLHSYHDDRDANNRPVDSATVMNDSTALFDAIFAATSRVESYEYDVNSNRTQMTVQVGDARTSSYAYYPNSDRLKSDGRYGYRYDANGNLVARGTSYTDLGATIGISPSEGEYWGYTYDLKNRLVSVSHGTAGSQSAATVASFTYDPTDLRLKTDSGANGVRYTIYGTDGNVLYSESQGGEIRADYLYLFGRYFAAKTTRDDAGGPGATTTSYYLTDNLGSTVMATDDNGRVIWSTDFPAFGQSGAEAGVVEESGRYTGKDFEEEIGLYYFNARWYDSSNGRYLTEDPAKDGSNWYIYAKNNPLRYVDPTGLIGLEDIEEAFKAAINFDFGKDQFVAASAAYDQGDIVGGATANLGFIGEAVGNVLLTATGLRLAARGISAAAKGLQGLLGKFAGKASGASVAGQATRYGPLNSGPLPEGMASTFRSGSYSGVQLADDTVLYRVYGGKASELGQFWTRTPPAGPLQSRIDLALHPEWGNTAAQVTRIRVPAGTTVYEGFAAGQGGHLLGGGSQVVIPRVDPSWVIR